MSSNLIVNNIEVGAGATIYTAASNQLTFGTNGSEKVRITSGGSVGINETNPSGKLEVKSTGATAVFNSGAASDGRLEFEYNSSRVGLLAYHSDRLEIQTDSSKDFTIRTNGANERLRITSAGKVGVGTISATSKLEVWNGSNIEVLRLKDTHFNKYLTIRGGGSPNRMVIDSYEGGGGGADIDFASNGSTKVRITSGGNVGIGFTNPGAVVHAYHATSNTIAQFESGDAGAAAIWKDNATYSSVEQNGNDFIIHADPGATRAGSALSFKIDGNERLRISNAGFVTINSSSYEALKITTTENGNNGPEVQLIHNSASPAANDCIGQLRFSGKDSAGNIDLMARIETIIDSPTSGDESAHLNFAIRGQSAFNTTFRIKRRGTASAPSYTADDIDGIIYDTYNEGSGSSYARHMSLIAKAAGNSPSNLSFWTEAVGGSPTEKVRITPDHKFITAGRHHLARTGQPPSNYTTCKETFKVESVANGASHTFQTSSTYGGGLVTITSCRDGNATFSRTQVYLIAMRATANSGVTPTVFNNAGGASGDSSFTVAGASKGITVTNNSGYASDIFVTFDIQGFVA